MTRYDFLGARRVTLSNVRTDSNLILILANLLDELGQIIAKYDFIEVTRMIFTNVWTDSQLDVNFSYVLSQIMSRYDLLELRWVNFWPMFKPTPTWLDFTFGQLLIWIMSRYDWG